jgi:phage tail sheath protein FI
MPEYLAPGVYVEEIQTGNKPIEGVSTSTAGLVGVTERGPVNVPQLVTSYGEYKRMFGGYMPADEFTDASGRNHACLPHAVEGFFVNGGKRAYVTRTLPAQATPAQRDLFFADAALASPGDTVLLRPAQQGSGTAVNQPLLYVLDPANFALNDWVRIGDGSRAEYRRIAAAPGAAQRHVALALPLAGAHAAGSALRAVAPTALAAYGAAFALDADVTAGDRQIVVTGAAADITALLNRLPPGPPAPVVTSEFLEIDAGSALEFAFASEALDLGGGRVQLNLSGPLRSDHAAAAAIRIDDPNPAGSTAATLALPANGGDVLIYPDAVAGNFLAAANVVILEPGSANAEAQGIGVLASLPLQLPTGAHCPPGSTVRLVQSLDDDRTLVLDANPVITLNRVAGLAAGMTLVFEVGGADESHLVDAVDAATSTVTLRAPGLSGATSSATVTLPAHTLTAAAPAGSPSIALDSRLGIAAGDVLRLGAAAIAIVREVVGARGAPPDAGALILEQPLTAELPDGTEVRRQTIAADTVRQPALLVLGAAAGADALLVNDGSGYVAGEVVEVTLPDTSRALHRLTAAAVLHTPREITLSAALERGHDAGLPMLERSRLLEIRALDAGAWGDRLLVGCREESKGLVSSAQILNANPPPGPGMFSSLQVSSVTGMQPGTVLEVLTADGDAADLPLLKVRTVDRASRLVLLDPPGLQATHMTAHNAALLAGLHLRLRSREFSLIVMLRQRPDATTPTRDDNLIDQEVFRHLSMDPRHSNYVMRVVGATWAAGSDEDDLGIPLRRWDRRSEGTSHYVRVLDVEPDAADREAIRLGPETLIDVMPSGLQRTARHPFAGGNDAVVMMGDAMYIGADSSEADLRTGIHTLKNLQTVSLVAVPGQTSPVLQQALIDHCEELRYRFAVLDGPPPNNDSLSDVQNHRQQYDSKYAALYHPWLSIADPFPTTPTGVRHYPVPPSGHVLGVYARVDNERGVHKAPANEVVRGIAGLARYFSKGEQDILNPSPVNINVVRDFRIDNRGIRVWGARCITSDSDYKYVNVRRLLIFIENSIDQGTQWVVFEPNADELWARVRRSIGNFLTTVWRNGALEGTTPEQAFFVKCDRTTMTRDDIDNGRLICVIGVAPVKPAEFVIIRIGLWTADAQE